VILSHHVEETGEVTTIDARDPLVNDRERRHRQRERPRAVTGQISTRVSPFTT
jgi:hypothetical protein